MIHERELESLVSQWKSRLTNSEFDDTLNDCIYDLTQLINNSYNEQDYIKHFSPEDALLTLQEQEADAYLASMEAHELS